MRLMNHMWRAFIGKFMVVYFDDDANLAITWSRNPYANTPIPGKPGKSGLIGV
jgi:hypothetical protein